MISFKSPWVLFTIPFILAFVIFFLRRNTVPTLKYSSNVLFKDIKSTWKIKAEKSVLWFRIIALILFIIALSGPRKVLEKTQISTEGIDIVLVIDASGSMAAMDFKLNGKRVNRIDAVKNVVEGFVKGRKGDRIALVVFAENAYTVCPLTTDYTWLIANLKRINLGVIKNDGTAIGSAIVTSLGRLEEKKAKSKIIILLTDGVNNSGKIDPITAAQAAKALGIKIYTIGAGTGGIAPYPVKDMFGRTVLQNMRVPFSGETLKQIARITNANYYGANDTDTLRSIYKEIDQLEKTKMKETGYREYKQLFNRFVYAGLIILVISFLLSYTLFLKIP